MDSAVQRRTVVGQVLDWSQEIGALVSANYTKDLGLRIFIWKTRSWYYWQDQGRRKRYSQILTPFACFI